MTPLRAVSALGLTAVGILASCSSDPDESVRDLLLACIVDGGGSVDGSADVVAAGDQALAVIGAVDASEALVSGCLDAANG